MINNSVELFVAWLKKNKYCSYDQYDFWSIRYGQFAKKVYYKNHKIGALFVGPIFLLELFAPMSRAIFVKKKRFSIADAHFIMSFVNLYKITNNCEYLDEAKQLAEQLLENSIPGYSGYCWGYPFDWQTNRGLWKKNTPLITNIPYCFEAFLKLYDVSKEKKYLDIVNSITQFAMKDLNETVTSDESSVCSYSPRDNSKVINANTYRSFLLMEAYNRFGDEKYKETAIRNINFVLESQKKDGSWLYAEGNPQDAFIDNFHTCFVLKNLFKANRHMQRNDVRISIKKGYEYYRTSLFTEDMVPKPFANIGRVQLTKIEMYDYAEGISLGVLLKDDIPGAFEMAQKLSQDIMSKYQCKDGHFVTRVSKGGLLNTVAYLRWPQSQMFHALTSLMKATKDN